MLCAKCGFITFDQLDACPKCKRDCTEVQAKFTGTVQDVESPSFLGSVAGGVSAEPAETAADMAGADSDQQDEPAEMVDFEEMPDEAESDKTGEIELAPDMMSEAEPEEKAELELPQASEEEPTLELGGDEDQELSLDGLELGGLELPGGDEGVDAGEPETEAEAPGEPAEEKEEAGLELGLSLEGEEEPAEGELQLDLGGGQGASEKEEKLAADLGKIDLSDLVAPGSEEEGAAPEPEEAGEEISLSLDEGEDLSMNLDLDTAGPELDLGAGLDEPQEAAPPIDLSLDGDEDVLDLSLDLEAGEPLKTPPAEEEPEIPDLGLSLDDD